MAAFEPLPATLIDEVCDRLVAGQRVGLSLPGGGRLSIDRLLPFLCVYRRNPRRRDAGTRMLVNGEAAYLNAPGDAPVRRGLRRLVRRIAETASARFGAFLVVEIWSAPDSQVPRVMDEATGEPLLPAPAFRILQRSPNPPEDAVNALKFALERIKLDRRAAQVEVLIKGRVHPPGSQPLLTSTEAKRINCFVLGLEIRPVYRDAEQGDPFPGVLRGLHRGVGRGLKKAFFAFALARTNVRPQHFYALGRRTLEKRVWQVDHQLAQVGQRFNFLLQVTPVNAESSWHQFQESRFQKAPAFQYRPLSVDPLLLKRELNRIPAERLVDPTLAHLFRQTQDELDRLITMLADVGTRRFLPGSLQVFGGVDPQLLSLANDILHRFPAARGDERRDQQLDAKELARRARREIRAYQRQDPSFTATVQVREDMFSGLLSSGGNLLIGRETMVPAQRVEALLAHEVGTHLVTYFNGLAQPLRLLSTGLAGYDALQEGLAVMSEHLVGGLSRGRLRMLAARVVAVHTLIEGADFVQTYRLLTQVHGFEKRTAYTVTLRIYRGGGLTKDAVYLRGLVEILDYLRRGGQLEPLLVGKLAVDHVPVVRELLHRQVLRLTPLTPRYMTLATIQDKLTQLRQGVTVYDLVGAC